MAVSGSIAFKEQIDLIVLRDIRAHHGSFAHEVPGPDSASALI